MSKSSITIAREKAAQYNPHPGDILLLDLLEPMAISQNALARAIKVSPRRINEIVQGKRAISADTDLRLCRYFGYAAGFFLRLQIDYDLMESQRKLRSLLSEIKPHRPLLQKRAA
jgi:antitoxin HigA-1